MTVIIDWGLLAYLGADVGEAEGLVHGLLAALVVSGWGLTGDNWCHTYMADNS